METVKYYLSKLYKTSFVRQTISAGFYKLLITNNAAGRETKKERQLYTYLT